MIFDIPEEFLKGTTDPKLYDWYKAQLSVIINETMAEFKRDNPSTSVHVVEYDRHLRCIVELFAQGKENKSYFLQQLMDLEGCQNGLALCEFISFAEKVKEKYVRNTPASRS